MCYSIYGNEHTEFSYSWKHFYVIILLMKFRMCQYCASLRFFKSDILKSYLVRDCMMDVNINFKRFNLLTEFHKPSRHKTLNQRWFNVGSPSKTLD